MLYFYVIDAIADDTVRYQYVKKKGYVRLHTNKGDLNVELHCDKVIKCIFTHSHQTYNPKPNSLEQCYILLWWSAKILP